MVGEGEKQKITSEEEIMSLVNDIRKESEDQPASAD